MTQKRVVVYARVSSLEQARPDSSSIEQQLERGEAYAASQGWEVIDRVADEGVTGSTPLKDRPGGKALLTTDAEVIVFWAMDRFTRSASRGLTDIEAMEARGTALVFVKEAIDTSTPSGRLFRTMLAAFAEFERESIRDRNMSGRFGSAEKGNWASGRPPFGYVLADDGKTLLVDDSEARVVREVFRLRRTGLSMPKIAERLNGRANMKPRPRFDRKTGGEIPARFSAGSVKHYLTNAAYKGGGVERSFAAAKGVEARTFVYPTPAIVDPTHWEEAQGSLVGRKRIDGAGERRHLYALSERVFHVHDDGTRGLMFGQRLKSGRRKYRCNRAWKTANGPASCPGLGVISGDKNATAVRADWVEAAVLGWLMDNLSTPEQVMEFLEKEEARLTPTVSEDEARADLDRLHARRERWLEMYAEGKCSKDDLDRHVQALDVEEAANRRLLDSHKHAAAARNRVAVTLEDLMGLRVEDTGEVDPNADEDPTRGSSQWREWLSEQAVAAFHHDKPLSSWAVEEVAYFSEALDLRVDVTASDDWQKPTVTLGVGSESVQEYLGNW